MCWKKKQTAKCNSTKANQLKTFSTVFKDSTNVRGLQERKIVCPSKRSAVLRIKSQRRPRRVRLHQSGSQRWPRQQSFEKIINLPWKITFVINVICKKHLLPAVRTGEVVSIHKGLYFFAMSPKWKANCHSTDSSQSLNQEQLLSNTAFVRTSQPRRKWYHC